LKREVGETVEQINTTRLGHREAYVGRRLLLAQRHDVVDDGLDAL
jgi:hypothetical protein